MDALIAEDRRLRDIRLSGSVVAGRLAMLGNLLPGTASVDSVRATADGFSIKGKALTIDAVGSALSRIIAENALPHPGAVRIAKDAGFFAGFSFEVGAGVVP